MRNLAWYLMAGVTILASFAPAAQLTAAEPEPSAQNMCDPASSNGPIPADWQSLHGRWAATLAKLKIAGMSVAVVQNDKVVLVDALGIRDPATGAPVVPDSPFYIASSTKSFTALAVAILADEGKLRLDDPVKRYLPRLELADKSVSESITVRDLLAHRQGIDSGPIATFEAYTGLVDEDRYYRLLKQVKSNGHFRYSNLNFTLLGRVIEAVSGQHWKQFVSERILRPAGMQHSYCLASRLYADRGAALPIVETNGQWEVARTQKIDATMHAAGGMGCSAVDLARWLRLNLNLGSIDGTRIVSETMAREMQSPQVKIESPPEDHGGFDNEDYGLGWFLGSHRGHPTVYHFGGYIGARCHISFMPRDKIGVAVLVNMSGPGSGIADVVAGDVYEKLLRLEHEDRVGPLIERAERVRAQIARRPVIEEMPLTATRGLSKPIGSYVGSYYHDDFGDLDVASEDGRLVFKLGAHRPLVASTASDQFMANVVPGSRCKCEFEIGPDGNAAAILVRDFFGPLRFARKE